MSYQGPKLDDQVFRSQWLVAMDRDGTIVPYAERPEEATVEPALLKLINDMAAQPGVHVAVVSARSVAQLRGDFGDSKVILAGNYGMEIRFPDGTDIIQKRATAAVPALKQVRDELAAIIEHGAILEDHGYTLCLHWHMVHADQLDVVHDAVAAAAARHGSLEFTRLPTSYEVAPTFAWNKGDAIGSIDEILPMSSGKRFHLFAGDSAADEPGFRWVNEHGGLSIKIGVTSDSEAQFQMQSPSDLHGYLRKLFATRASLLALHK